MNLVIVESPHKAHTIQKFLGEGYTVVSSKGHIRDLQEKSLSVDIEHDFTPEYVIPADKKKTVAELKALAAKADTVWLASDEDREGEAISWHLTETLGLKPENTKRITFHEITKNAILEAIKNPRTVDMKLVDAQQARRVLDRLVGFELSPVLWRKIKRGLSAGRVQSVALRLVVDREKEIMAFTPEAYYRIEGEFSTNGAKVKGTLDGRFKNGAEARRFLEDSIGAQYEVESVETRDGSRFPAAPFTTSTLQQEAGRKLHMSVNTTMRIAQGLYEKGLITYMRTDSTNLSGLALNTAKEFILDNFGPEYSHPRQYKTKAKGAQEAHEAIRPTFIANTDIDGTAQDKALYSLIWKRTIASQMAEAKVANTVVKVESDKRPEKFVIESSNILFDGFLKVYIEGSDDDAAEEGISNLPPLTKGQALDARTISAICKFTQAPMRYTQPSLVKKLEELGIGRPSTYGTIITTLTSGRGYVEEGNREGTPRQVSNFTLKGGAITENEKTELVGADKKKLLPTEIGMAVTDYLVENFDEILDYGFTANVETAFDKIAEGKAEWHSTIGKFYSAFHPKIEASLQDRNFKKVERVIGNDPADGKLIVAKLGQFGPYIQKGDPSEKIFASLPSGVLFDNVTLDQAVKLFQLPRTVGRFEDMDVTVFKGKFGPYLKHGDKNVSLPKGTDPLKVTLEECVKAIGDSREKASKITVIREFPSGISVMNGLYGPYIKTADGNYKIAKGTDAAALTEEQCNAIIASSAPAARKKSFRKFKKK